MTRIALAALLLFVFACAATPEPQLPRPQFAIPPADEMSEVERLGNEIYVRDQLAWQATDAVGADTLRSRGVQGWITVPYEDGWVVRFVGRCESIPCAYFDVEFGNAGGPPRVVEPQLAILRDEQAAAWRARETAREVEFRACTAAYNTVVIPHESNGRTSWRVYLLASTTDPQLVILTGHHRIEISGDGNNVIANEPLSRSCMSNKVNPQAVGMFLTHNLHPEPIETHVFTSLNYRMPLFVGTERGTYEVQGARVRRVDGVD